MKRRMAEAQADNNALSRQLERLSVQQVYYCNIFYYLNDISSIKILFVLSIVY